MHLNLILTTWLRVTDAQAQGRSPRRVCWREGVWGWVPGPPCSGPPAPCLLLEVGSHWPGQRPAGSKQRKPQNARASQVLSASQQRPGGLSLVGAWGCGVTTGVPALGSGPRPGSRSSAGQPAPHSESHPSSTLGRRSWVRMGEGGRAGHLWPGSPPAPVSWPRGPAGQVLAPARRPLALEV